MFFPLLLTVLHTSVGGISPARSVAGLLFPILNVDTALLQVVFQVNVIGITLGIRSMWELARLPHILPCYILLLQADR